MTVSTSITTSDEVLADDPRPPDLGPVKPSERIAALDILRGFALLGICVINLQDFLAPRGLETETFKVFPGKLDQVADFCVNLFGSGKFNSMFSILFGIGFAIQMGRAGDRKAAFAPMYLRRLAALFVFGVAHVIFLWGGDILHIYAVIGAFLIVVRPLKDRWLWALVVVCLFLPFARVGIGKAIFHEQWNRPPAEGIAEAKKDLVVYGHGTYPEVVKLRTTQWVRGYTREGGAWFILPLMGTTLLIGYIIGRRGVFQDLPRHLPAIRRICLWSGVVGFAIAVVFATAAQLAPRGTGRITFLGVVTIVGYILGRPVLCAFYMTAIVLLSFRPGWDRLLKPLELVGRMPLTNYLMHSVIFATLFYGYGFGLYYNPARTWQIGPAASLLIAFGVFAIQVVYSNWWMNRFRFGPMEWLWRTLTYGKPPAMTTPSPIP